MQGNGKAPGNPKRPGEHNPEYARVVSLWLSVGSLWSVGGSNSNITLLQAVDRHSDYGALPGACSAFFQSGSIRHILVS